MKEKFFSHTVCNVIIVVSLVILSLVATAGGDSVSVFGAKNEALYNGNRDSRKVTLMINVYWGTEFVLPMAELIKKYGFTTTFFVGGSWADDNADILKRLDADGFEIANHGYFHLEPEKTDYNKQRDEILMTQKLLEATLNKEPVKLFAPPSGSLSQNMFDICRENGYKVIMWSRDTVDWRDKDSSLVYRRAVNNMQGGDLVLMHPTTHTLQALPDILDYIKKSGLILTTVSDNLS